MVTEVRHRFSVRGLGYALFLFYGGMCMQCENNYCIYEEDGECILSEISVDSCGNCSECIVVNISKDLLARLKSECRKKLEDQYSNRQK